MTRLTSKNVIITGGASGMGLEMATLFGKEGARVAIIDINFEQTKIAAERLKGQGIHAVGFGADVTDESAVNASILKIAEGFDGAIHILVNNAGIIDFGSVEETSLANWESVMGVNITGTFLCSKATLPFMKKQGGAIVNLGSVAGIVGIPQMAAYCAAKAAVIGLTKQMAAEYTSQGIRVNSLCPGTVADTNLGRQLLGSDASPEMQAKRLAKYPIGRFGKTREIANAALFLASDEASFVSGATFSVDGGMTAI